MSTETTDFGRYGVLAAIDGSENSTVVVRYAAAEAKRTGTGLHLLHVIPDVVALSPMLPLVPSELEQTGHAILAKAGTEAASTLGPDLVTSSLARGSRATCLVRAADQASLVVLGREAESSLHRLVTGATTLGVAGRAPCPAVAVPPGWAATPEKGRLVVGLKSTKHATVLLRRAFLTAEQRHAELVFVHAWELPSGYDDMLVRGVDEHEWSELLRGQVDQHLARWRADHPRVRVELRVVHAQPARTLRDASEEADLLLLLRRLHGVTGGHLGGTGRLLLRESVCPVEVVPRGAGAGIDSELVLEQDGELAR
jgi:nucleotide-binding universal stress UspA family protein